MRELTICSLYVIKAFAMRFSHNLFFFEKVYSTLMASILGRSIRDPLRVDDVRLTSGAIAAITVSGEMQTSTAPTVGASLCNKTYVDGLFTSATAIWDRTGTDIEPDNAGDNLKIDSISDQSSGGISISSLADFTADLKTDQISESTGSAGITFNQVTIHSGNLQTDQISEKTGSAGITLNQESDHAAGLKTDDISEHTGSNGITMNHLTDFVANLKTDQISEHTGSAGITLNQESDHAAGLKTDDISEHTGANGITMNHLTDFVANLKTDQISEHTGSAGITMNHNVNLASGVLIDLNSTSQILENSSNLYVDGGATLALRPTKGSTNHMIFLNAAGNTIDIFNATGSAFSKFDTSAEAFHIDSINEYTADNGVVIDTNTTIKDGAITTVTVDASTSIAADSILEHTADNGVVIDTNTTIKDGAITTVTVDASTSIAADSILEHTADNGVAIDTNTTIKDGLVTSTTFDATTSIKTDAILEHTASAGVTIDTNVLIKDGTVDAGTSVTTDTISEHSANNGVTIEGITIKDSMIVDSTTTFMNGSSGGTGISVIANTSGNAALTLQREGTSNQTSFLLKTGSNNKWKIGSRDSQDSWQLYNYNLSTDSMYINYLGSVFFPQAYDDAFAGGTAAYWDTDGHIGIDSSTLESKTNIKVIADASWIYDLVPKTFNYRKSIGKLRWGNEYHKDVRYGLIAEDIEKINPQLCNYRRVKDHVAKCPYSGKEMPYECKCSCKMKRKIINYKRDDLISPIIHCLKKQREEIEMLKKRLA